MELKFSGFEQRFLKEGEVFIPRFGVNVERVVLDASEKSRLDWADPQGDSMILWELDFNLEWGALSDEMRYLSLEIACDHFVEKMWSRFESKTLGVALYRGPFDPDKIEYVRSLAARLPEQALAFVYLETDLFKDPLSYFRALSGIHLGHLIPIVQSKWLRRFPYALPALSWQGEGSAFEAEQRVSKAICLPERGGEGALLHLIEELKETPFRVIPELHLTLEWEGVETLYAAKTTLGLQTRRKLSGFEAAGGKVVIVDHRDDEAVPQLQETSQRVSPAVWH